MELPERRMSGAQYRNLAGRWRQLAADATTPRARDHLLTLARQCEFLALGGVRLERNEPEEEQPGSFGNARSS
jgi:hypothetical protein